MDVIFLLRAAVSKYNKKTYFPMVTKATEKNKVKRMHSSGQGRMLFYCQDDRVTFEKYLKGLRK